MNLGKNYPYIIIAIVLLAIVIGAGWWFYKLSQAKNAQNTQDQSQDQFGLSGRQWSGGKGGNRGNFKPLHGAISEISDSIIVIKTNDGSSKNIATTSDTRIMKMENGQRITLEFSDLKVGDEINIMAQDSNQSTITARMIFIGTFSPPINRGQGQGGGVNDNLQEENFDSSSLKQI